MLKVTPATWLDHGSPAVEDETPDHDSPKRKIVICYSGGLDSMMMVALAKHRHPDAEIICLFFDHGQDSAEAEIAALPSFVKVRVVDWLDHEVRAVPKKSDPFAGPIYIPGRNLVFGALAACQYLPDEVWMGTLWDECNEQATDKNLVFLDKLNDTLKYALSPFTNSTRVVFPFVDAGWTKTEALRYLLNVGAVSKDDIAKTTSCWHNVTGTPCGLCKQCVKRALIMNQFGIVEKHESEFHPLDPANEYAANLIAQYEAAVDPNIDEMEVRRLIKFWRENAVSL